MLTLNRRCPGPTDGTIVPVLSLPFDARQKSRFRAALPDGSEVAVFLDRRMVLRDGEHLCGECGLVVRVEAAPENVSEVRSGDPLLLMRASYHLGNRHVPLQVLPGGLRYLHDHVLDEMVRGLGLEVGFAHAPFEPEPGAYAHTGHGHHHAHQHAHGH